MGRDRERDGKDADESSASSQSKRPVLNHQESDSTNSNQAHREHHHQHRSKPQKHVVGAGRLHARVPSSKALHKHHGSTGSKLNHRRQASPSPERKISHRRVQSEAKLSRDSSSANLHSSSKNASATSLRRNKSHGEVNKTGKTRLADDKDKLKRTNSNPAVNKVKSQKSQVHFDLGNDGQDDEWVDASTSASPYLSRRGSLASTQASAKPDDSSANNSKSETSTAQPSPPVPSASTRQTVQHKEYLTSRLLQRTPSHGAPPKMTADTVSVSRRGHSQSPDSIGRGSTLADSHNISTLPSSGDELISRFVNAGSSGAAREGSFYQLPTPRPGSQRSERPLSVSSGRHGRQGRQRDLPLSDDDDGDGDGDGVGSGGGDGTALAPRSGRRFAPPAEKSRTQQKLNLQRASSVIEPGQAVGGGVGAVGASPLVGIGGPGYDGGASRDPRVTKQLERTGMEYLSVRRFQNPVVRSLDRLAQVNRTNKNQRIPRNGTASVNGKASSMRAGVVSGQHLRNSSLNDAAISAAAAGGSVSGRRPVTPRAYSIRTNGGGSSYEADADDHQSSRTLHEGTGVQGLSGSSLVGGEEDEGVTAILRNLWEKNPDLSASQD